MRDLSVLIPARNEMFLKKTIESVLENIEADTEIIVISDGDWPVEPLDSNPRVTLVKTGKSVGQRAATNMAARISTAKYIMKLDAHCTVDKGFDRKLIADCEYDWTVIPAMYNLHVFNWKCLKCGNEWYQGPTPTVCYKDRDGKVPNQQCDGREFERAMKWQRREGRRTEFMRFDSDLHFQYWGEFKNRPEAQGEIAETMSNIGACWFMHRQRYWDMDGLDEAHGSWGQMGTELSCKTWLSGGRQVVNKKTWFAHLFRTQGGDFGFPYENPQSKIDNARKHSKKLWLENAWPKAIHDLQWLVDKFAPIPGWHNNKSSDKKLTKGVVYYTDNLVNEKIGEMCRKQIIKGMKEKHIVSVALQPIDFGGKQIVINEARGYLTMAKQILAGLEASTADIIFLCEHDVLYDPSHFDFIPPQKDVYYYNTNVWQLRAEDGHAIYMNDCKKLSQLCAYRDTLITHFKKRVEMLEKATYRADGEMGSEWFNRYIRNMGFEPGTHSRDQRVDDLKAESRFSRVPSIDIRHKDNLTPSRWRKDQFRNQKFTEGWKEGDQVPGWPKIVL